MTESIGPFHIGDSPTTPVELALSGDEAFDLYTSADVTLTNATGTTVASWTDLPIDEEAITILVSIPVGSFQTAGIYHLTPRLIGHGTVTLPGVPVIVEANDGWHTVESARGEWAGAPDDAALFTLLNIAKGQVLAYAPRLTSNVPDAYRKAQVMQARNLYNASSTDPNGSWNGGDMVIRTAPTRWTGP
ncbi:hypothetical protein DEI93_07155 [Curtobacterium sp. MCBD17_035]|uniref:hypothetical protein n=1 Tax=Curtobacterium sp. MCBD17_035 TaxID=2175673 RepID=UPI000DA7BD7C|nr:hypothetical protein [Curtobacterium sp. MCBD17_035]WIB68799.1 hypothetical protein DEI93_07155 [Curtobacterium sp. MCBD17_035]